MALQYIGHRGACGHAPENTLASVRRALELGVDGIEIDVRYAHGKLWVIHDEAVGRTTDGHGRLGELTPEALRRLDAGGGERIPWLEEVIGVIGGRVLLNIELKGRGAALPVAAMLEEAVAGGVSREQFLISSFEIDELRRLRGSRWPLGALFESPPPDALEIARGLPAVSVHLDWRSVSAPFVHAAHAAGLRVLVYTVNTVSEATRMLQMGVDGIFSDFPDRVQLTGS